MLIELTDVSFSYLAGSPAEVRALTDVSFGIGAGDFVALVGPMGSGKSTLAEIMAGLAAPTSGRVYIDGVDVAADRKAAAVSRRSVGLVFQQPEKQLFESTVERDVAFWPKNAGLAPELISERVAAALEAVGLDYEKYRSRSPFALSGGEMRKVAIAGILAMEPRLLIMDEPAAGLDPRGKRELLGRISALNKAGTAVMMVTHDMDDAAELASRVLVLDRGRLVGDDEPRRIFCSLDPTANPLPSELGLPTAPRIARLLRAGNFNVAGDPLTLDELERGIVAALRKASV